MACEHWLLFFSISYKSVPSTGKYPQPPSTMDFDLQFALPSFHVVPGYYRVSDGKLYDVRDPTPLPLSFYYKEKMSRVMSEL
jgi:hypothetical protein